MKGRQPEALPVLWCAWIRRRAYSPWTCAVRAAPSEQHARERLEKVAGRRGYVEAQFRRADRGPPT
jgi:hypothetical protein